ncbi:MAG: heavy metal translocating P-type ATPase [Oscillospiraceae bacterium]|nr:heavy metal translocating P-type ATPase [Oscillospiraceae bacterium]
MEQLSVNISGMSCAACAQNIERLVQRLDGVTAAEVNFGTETLTLAFNPAQVSFDQINGAMLRAGYTLHLPQEDEAAARARRKAGEMHALWRRFVWSAVFTVPLMVFAMVPMFLKEAGIDVIPYHLNPLHYPAMNMMVQALLTAPVLLVNRTLFRDGFRSLLLRHPNMDSLIAKGTTVAVLYSLYLTVQNVFFGAHYIPYYEVAAVILMLVVLGKYLEAKTKGKTSAAIEKLMGLAPKTAHVIRDGVEIEIPIECVVVGDIIVVRPGENMPVDGVVVSGETAVDEAMLTGESMPVQKKAGDQIIGASINGNGAIRYRATKVGKDTVLAQIIRLVEQAQASKAPIARLADVISGYFVHAVIIIAVLSGAAWLVAGAGLAFSLRIFIAVLVIACPCALGLATPTAIMVGTGKGAEHGILIKSGEALETAHKLDTVVLDKTGTVTEGKPRVTDIVTKSGHREADVLRLAAAAEHQSEHPLGTAIVVYGREVCATLPEAEGFHAITGQGIQATVEGKCVLIGNRRLMDSHHVPVDDATADCDRLASGGKTPMYVVIDSTLAAIIAVADVIKPTSKKAVADLQAMGLEVIMLTGDNRRTAEAIAREAGIDTILAEVLPQEKAEHVKTLQTQGKKVAMVGDGINDAVALVQADVGIAIGSGTDVAMESAQVVLMRGDLTGVVAAILLSKKTLRNIKQNLFWAFGYNVLGIPIAMGALYLFGGPLMSPMIAALAMSFSSVSLLLNVLRLKRLRLDV